MPIPQTRTRWAEEQSEELLAIPFISEFVFRSPQVWDKTQKEVADLLIFHRGKGLLVSQKAQEDPESRDDHKNELWVLKYAKAAVSQLVGALRSGHKNIWCAHPRRGRVDFPDGLPPIAHGVVIVETFRPVDLQAAVADLPLDSDGVPIAYMSINDFLNVASQLRTVPELLAYLDARRELPDSALRRVGDELVLFDYYLLRRTLRLPGGHQEARQTLESCVSEVDDLRVRMTEHRYYSSLLEHVANELATRSPTCLEGLSSELTAMFDPAPARQSYLRMQEILTDLTLRERAELGRQFDAVVRNLDGRRQGYTQATALLDSKPEWIFVFASSKGWDRSGMLRCMGPMMGAALAQYQKQHCMIVTDRDGAGYEVAVTRPDVVFVPSATDLLNGKKLFGNLRTSSVVAEGF
jgi:hypothetical protein